MHAAKEPSRTFLLFVTGVTLILTSRSLLSDGMFVDGLLYATISKNLAGGLGTWWNLHFSATLYPQFHEHPPLAFWIESILYRLFGDSRFIERIYSVSTFILTGLLILKIWRHSGRRHGWIPVGLWLSIPLVMWAIPSNMLENTLTVFTTLSMLMYLKSTGRRRFLFILLSGLSLSLGFLTKGFVAFFPWTFPFFLWLALRQKTFTGMLADTGMMALFTAVPVLVLALAIPEAGVSLQKYLDTQVLNSLQNVVTVDSRFYIVKNLLTQLIPPAALCLLVTLIVWRRKASLQPLRDLRSQGSAWFLTAMAGVLPIMLSMKQREFYLLPVFPVFALAFGSYIYPLLEMPLSKIRTETKAFRWFRLVSLALVAAGILLSLWYAPKIGRDKVKLNDTYAILPRIPSGTTVSILPQMYGDWGLHGYFARYKNISLEPGTGREYLLVSSEFQPDPETLKNYMEVGLGTTKYHLMKRR